MLTDEQHAREAMQDVFVQILRRQDTLDDRGLGRLLHVTATNVCLNRLRTRTRKPRPAGGDLLERIADASAESAQLEARDLLRGAFAREPASSAVIAVLHLADGLTLEQTAAIVGMSVSGVRHRLRALEQTLRELSGDG